MATTKKNVKVRDLKPAKDAKGGGGPSVNKGFKPNSGNSTNTTKPSGHHHQHNN
jgi:hypothetical protein